MICTMKRCKGRGRLLSHLFTYFKNTFDSLDHRTLWKALDWLQLIQLYLTEGMKGGLYTSVLSIYFSCCTYICIYVTLAFKWTSKLSILLSIWKIDIWYEYLLCAEKAYRNTWNFNIVLNGISVVYCFSWNRIQISNLLNFFVSNII